MTYMEKCKELGFETLRFRRAQKDLLLAHKFIGGSTAGKENLLKKTYRPDRVRTKHAEDPNSLVPQCERMDMRKFSFEKRVGDSWNKLGHDMRNCAKKGKFKVKIKDKLETHQLNSKIG
jgi:hypothetical protein